MNSTTALPSPAVPKIKRPTSKIALFLAALLVVGFLVAVFFPASAGSRRNPSLQCASQVKMICAAALIWADERATNQLPSSFIQMSNELVTPRILLCPLARKKFPARDWVNFTSENYSYQLVGPGTRTGTTNVYVRCEAHRHLGLGDGSLILGAKR